MKKIILTLVSVFLLSNFLIAQEFKQEADLIKSIIGKAKKDYVSQYLEIPSEKKQQFWAYYDNYETKRQQLGDQRLEMIMRYSELFDSNDPKAYKNLVTDVISLHKSNENNLKKYFNLINKNVDTKTAMQFFQVEEYIRANVESKLYGNLPLK